ncbi:MAG: exodeoxyribonuclease V subunit gamma [Lachnospiraceae bacterium]|nr:exodeoxyribonuclease V subunit gamma [Lachnospiraceae bacterium]
MALQFILGGSGSGKSEYVQNLAIKIALESRKNNVLMIVPDQFTMQTQWRMANAHPNGGILNIDVLSFSRLPRKVFEEVGSPKRIMLDDTGKSLLIKRGATKVKDELHVLSKGMDNPGWSAEVKSVISEFMQYNVSLEEVDRIIKECKSESLRLKLTDLKLLYEVFLKECEEKYLTKEVMLDMFVERLPLSKKVAESVLIFDGFTGFTPIQIKAITALLIHSKDVYITLPFDNDESENPRVETKEKYLFDLTKRNIRDLIRACDENRIEIQSDVRLTKNLRHANNPDLAYLEKNLFRNDNASEDFNGAVRIFKCSDIDNECRTVCDAILKEINENDLRYRDVALICADMTKYQKPIAKYLTRYNIPHYIDANRTILNNLFVKYIIGITDILKNNFRAEDVVRFLRTGLSPLEEEEIDRLENYIYARGIKGIAKWKKPFTTPSAELFSVGETLDFMDSCRERFIGIFENITKDGKKKRKLSEWIAQIYGIIEEGKIAEKLSEKAKELTELGLIEEAMEYESVYNKVMELFDAICDLMGDEDFTVKDLNDILRVGFSEIRVGILPQKVDSLLVGDMQRTRLKEIKMLFIVGVNDGNIPSSETNSGLLSLPDKEEMKQLNCALAPTSDELAFIEQLYIYLNLTKPTDKLYISFASVGPKGESLIPSYLIDILQNMYKGLEVEKMMDYRSGLFLSDIKEDTGKLIGFYVSGTLEPKQEEELFRNIRIIKRYPGGEEWCKKIIENAFRVYEHKGIDIKTAKALYGDIIKVSVSTLEKFAECQYLHFVSNGLSLKNRETFELDSFDMGNLAHDVLEEIGNKLKEKDFDFSTAAEELVGQEIDSAIEVLINEYDKDLFEADEKTKYYATQLSRIMKRTVKTLGFQLSKGKFKPEMYEKKFENNYAILDGNDEEAGKILLKGRVDRTDIYDDGNGNKYVKIIDYKSSEHKFSEDALKNGTSLQLAIYMKSIIDMLKEKYPNDNIIPAAMLYYEVDDPFVGISADTEKDIRNALIPTGALVKDAKIIEGLDSSLSEGSVKSEVIPVKTIKDGSFGKSSNLYTEEEFNGILNLAEETAMNMALMIMLGQIEINPIKKGNDTSCKYCDLKGVCGFDAKIEGYKYRTENGDEPEESDITGEDSQEND